jgi:hypothetical protein
MLVACDSVRLDGRGGACGSLPLCVQCTDGTGGGWQMLLAAWLAGWLTS